MSSPKRQGSKGQTPLPSSTRHFAAGWGKSTENINKGCMGEDHQDMCNTDVVNTASCYNMNPHSLMTIVV